MDKPGDGSFGKAYLIGIELTVAIKPDVKLGSEIVLPCQMRGRTVLNKTFNSDA